MQASVGRRLSDFIVGEGLISAEQKRTGERLADLVVRLGLLTETQIVRAQSQHYRIPSVPFPDSVPSELLRLVPSAIARSEICTVARDQGMRTLREAGLAKVLEGVTTLEEVLRVTTE